MQVYSSDLVTPPPKKRYLSKIKAITSMKDEKGKQERRLYSLNVYGFSWNAFSALYAGKKLIGFETTPSSKHFIKDYGVHRTLKGNVSLS